MEIMEIVRGAQTFSYDCIYDKHSLEGNCNSPSKFSMCKGLPKGEQTIQIFKDMKRVFR